MHLTAEMAEAAYDLLRTTPPFRGWRLPPAEDVEFRIIHSDTRCADYFQKADGTHVIRLNAKWIGALNRLIQTLAHEMVHLAHQKACPSDQGVHGKWFMQKAAQVCRHHHFDPKGF